MVWAASGMTAEPVSGFNVHAEGLGACLKRSFIGSLEIERTDKGLADADANAVAITRANVKSDCVTTLILLADMG